MDVEAEAPPTRKRLRDFFPFSRRKNDPPLPPMPPLPESRVSLKEIQEFMPRLHQAVHELKDRFSNDDYGALIGLDTSGRTITLIMQLVINHVNEKHGKPKIPTVFVRPYRTRGGEPLKLSDKDKENLHFKLRSVQPRQRALVVDDFLHLGETMEPLGKELGGAQIPYDIITVRQYQSDDRYLTLGAIRRDGQIYPKITHLDPNIPPLIWNKPHLSGFVSGESPVRSAHTQYEKGSYMRRSILESVRNTRVQVQKAAQELIVTHGL